MASTMVASNVSVITPAELPYKPWLPKPLLFLALALVLGSMFGVMTAFFVEYLDNSIKTTDELEKVCHIPALGVVPLYQRKWQETAPRSARNPSDSSRIINPGPCSARLFFIFAPPSCSQPQGGLPKPSWSPAPIPTKARPPWPQIWPPSWPARNKKCLIMDCDLRKPSLHKVYSLPLQPGLTNYLTGNADLESIIRPTDVPNLFFIPAGPTPPSPHELLNSTAFQSLLDRLRQDFQHIIIDSPPVIGFADGRIYCR